MSNLPSCRNLPTVHDAPDGAGSASRQSRFCCGAVAHVAEDGRLHGLEERQ